MRKILAAMAAMLTLAACASVQRLGAANDVHALLLAIRDNDQATFDAHVDHNALKAELQDKVEQQIGHNKQLKGLASLLGPQVYDFAGDALLRPSVFKLVAEQYGYTPSMKIPSAFALSTVLKTLPDGRVCATRKKDGPCLLVFTKEGDAWKLTSFEGDTSMLHIKL